MSCSHKAIATATVKSTSLINGISENTANVIFSPSYSKHLFSLSHTLGKNGSQEFIFTELLGRQRVDIVRD